jgi:hypothetical protein
MLSLALKNRIGCGEDREGLFLAAAPAPSPLLGRPLFCLRLLPFLSELALVLFVGHLTPLLYELGAPAVTAAGVGAKWPAAPPAFTHCSPS